ncbi:MAG: hypothetical protein ABH952_11015 [Candidatus Omnitrophota bacterium]
MRGIVLVELNATKGVMKIDEAQVHNYLKATQNGSDYCLTLEEHL